MSTGFYDIAIKPLVESMTAQGIKQCWLADDLGACGTPEDLKAWYAKLEKEGPEIGYYPNPEKSWIVAHTQDQIDTFTDDEKTRSFKTTTLGAKYLGGGIGTKAYKDDYVKNNIDVMNTKIKKLVQI